MLFRPSVSHSDGTANSGKHKLRNVFLTEGAEQEVAPVFGRDLGHSGITSGVLSAYHPNHCHSIAHTMASMTTTSTPHTYYCCFSCRAVGVDIIDSRQQLKYCMYWKISRNAQRLQTLRVLTINDTDTASAKLFVYFICFAMLPVTYLSIQCLIFKFIIIIILNLLLLLLLLLRQTISCFIRNPQISAKQRLNYPNNSIGFKIDIKYNHLLNEYNCLQIN